MVLEQGELFPSANQVDIKCVKIMLAQYPEMLKTIKEYEAKELLTEKQADKLKEYKHKVTEIDTAFELILDDEVKAIIKHRYVKAKKHKYTILTYTANSSKATVNRRVKSGVLAITNSLKLADII